MSRGTGGLASAFALQQVDLPDREPYLTTIAFTDGTLANAKPEIDAAISRALAR